MKEIGLNYEDLHKTKDITIKQTEKTGLYPTLKRIISNIIPSIQKPKPKIEKEITINDTINYKDAVDYLNIHNAVEEVKQEEKEKQKRRAERKQNN